MLLDDLDKNDLYRFGIVNLKHKIDIIYGGYQPQQYLNEGHNTDYH